MAHTTARVFTASVEFGIVGSCKMSLHARHKEAGFYASLGVSFHALPDGS
jgi:hypothetical protein